jgi:hypothetical protein
MHFQDLIRAAIKENKEKDFYNGYFVSWLLNGKIGELITAIKLDPLNNIRLKKAYCGKNTIDKLENSDYITEIITLMGSMGYVEEASEIFEIILCRTPYDTAALNGYGYVLLNELLIASVQNKKYSKKKIQFAHDIISKAATVDKSLTEEPLSLPSYRNLCFFKAIEAEYYHQNNAHLAAFLIAWMSIEMSVYRLFYTHLKENKYSENKIADLLRWNIDTIIELLYMNKCDKDFVNLKNELDSLRKLRNHLIHGTVFDVSKDDAKRCIDTAEALTLIKITYDLSLTAI